MSPSPPSGRFAVVVPVKPPAVGKSRLVGSGLDADARRTLARAFALDTVEAAGRAERVGALLALTDDAWFAGELAALGCATIPDGVSLDLNGTLRQGAREAARRWPDLQPVALCADLPALRPGDLDAALAEAHEAAREGRAAYVVDAEGLGTTTWTAPPEIFDPRFGPGSALAHDALGARAVEAAAPGLRRDVDDLADLAEAAALGLGPRTAPLAAALLPG